MDVSLWMDRWTIIRHEVELAKIIFSVKKEIIICIKGRGENGMNRHIRSVFKKLDVNILYLNICVNMNADMVLLLIIE